EYRALEGEGEAREWRVELAEPREQLRIRVGDRLDREGRLARRRRPRRERPALDREARDRRRLVGAVGVDAHEARRGEHDGIELAVEPAAHPRVPVPAQYPRSDGWAGASHTYHIPPCYDSGTRDAPYYLHLTT